MAEAYIYDAVRTPRGRGKPDGGLHEVSTLKLAAGVLGALRDRTGLDTHLVDDVIMGCVDTVGESGSDIARAAEAFRADIVALSFSGVLPPAQVRAGLQEMRAQLPTQIAVWAGGQGAAGLMEAVAGVQVLRELEDMPPALALWRAERSLG